MSVVVAVTFGQKYNHEEHPYLPGITASHYLLVEGEDRAAARDRAFALTHRLHAFDYPYSEDGRLCADFQRQIGDYGYIEYVLAEGESA